MKNNNPSIFQIALPQIVGYIAGAIGFILPLIMFGFVVVPLFDYLGVIISPSHQKYIIVALLGFSSIMAIIFGGIGNAVICRHMKTFPSKPDKIDGMDSSGQNNEN